VGFAWAIQRNTSGSAESLKHLDVCLRQILNKQLAIVAALSGMDFDNCFHFWISFCFTSLTSAAAASASSRIAWLTDGSDDCRAMS
jgi:hypothetical protein